MDDDVAVPGAGADLDGLGIGFGARRDVEVVAQGAVPGVEVEIGGHALADADLDPAGRRLGDDPAARDLGEPEGAVRGPGVHGSQRAVDIDGAVGGFHAEVGPRDADPGGPVGVLDRGAAVRCADAHGAGAGRDLGEALGAVNRDVPEPGPAAALSEPPQGVDGPHPGVGRHVRAGRQDDLYIDRILATPRAVVPPAPGRPDLQPAGGELDASLFRELDVALAGGVARPDL